MCGVVYYSELFPNHIRSRGVSLAIATIALTDLVYLQVTTTAFEHIGWRFFLVFIIISGLGAIYLGIFLIETKGVPLEEMAAKFGDDADVAVFISDVRVDHETHEVIFEDHHHQGVAYLEPKASYPKSENVEMATKQETAKEEST